LVYRLKSLSNMDNRIFLQREWISLAIVFCLVVFGNRTSSAGVLALAAVFISFCILKSDISNAFCWALFLVPNIRMLDGIGITFTVNAMMALPLIVYFFRMGFRKLSAVALLGSVSLCIMELFHDAALANLENVVTIIGWSLNMFLAIIVTVDSRVNISKNDIFSALASGIIMSAVMYLSSGRTSILLFLENLYRGARFSAFADDPNYYSLYICLTIACILNVTGKSIYKFCITLLLVGIGLLTASKMCILLMVFEFVLIFLQIFNNHKDNRDNKKFIVALSIGLLSGLIILRDYVIVFANNFIRRLGDLAGNSFDLDRITSGRMTIVMEYLEILFNDFVCFFAGYGFNYHLFLDQSSRKGAHNTYLDLILAWGIVGVIIFIIILYYWIKIFKKSRNIQKIEFIKRIPMIVLLINFLDLSCLSASMFPFVIAVVMIQCIPTRE